MGFKIAFCVIIIGMLLELESCYLFRKPNDDIDVMCSRLIVNQTDQSIILKVFGEFNNDRVQNIKQDSSWLMEGQTFSDKVKPFEIMNSAIDSVAICSINGETLKVWRKSERSEDEGHFFYESSWQKREWEDKDYTYIEWTFKLVPEDVNK